MTKKLHFIGIGGSGISGVASLAEKSGYKVSGCDAEGSTAYQRNIVQGHSPKHIEGVDLVITSPALFYQEMENSEISAAKELNRLVTWQEFLGKVLLKDKKVIAIAGTHGKSTTTAMAGKMLIDAGFDPTIVVGATVPEWGGNSRYGRGQWAVVEADEFNDNFLNYSPDIILINNIEFDHPDYFKNGSEVKASFDKFTARLKGKKILITESVRPNKKFNLKIMGEHNQKNANMVYALGLKLGIPEETIISSIEGFEGIGRRMELIADRAGVKIFDDYAHHPTAIRVTLEGVRQKYPSARILVIDEPHGYKRTKALLSQYKGVFDSADKVFVGPIFKARDEVDKSVSPGLIAKTSAHKNIESFDSFEKLIENCKLVINHYNVVVIMGAGKSYLWARKIADLLPISFKNLTSFRTGGNVQYFFKVDSVDEILGAVSFAKSKNLKIFVLGDGTDILVSDKNYDGVVIKYIGRGLKISDDGTVVAEGGANWDDLVEAAVDRGFSGLEALSGIPGTVGAAPIQNIGAYGSELKDVFVSLKAFSIDSEKVVSFNKEDCKFGYRESIFKSPEFWQKYIIYEVTLKLNKNDSGAVKYESLGSYVASKHPSIREIREAVLKVRSDKLEDPKIIGNAGSFFKNPIVGVKKKQELESNFEGIKIFPFGDRFKISAAWLIEKAGWKGKKYKSAAVSSKHSLILVNPGGSASSNDVYELSQIIIDDVEKKFGVKLEREVQLINF